MKCFLTTTTTTTTTTTAAVVAAAAANGYLTSEGVTFLLFLSRLESLTSSARELLMNKNINSLRSQYKRP